MRRMTERTLSLLAVTTVFLLTVSGTARAQAAFTVTAHSGSLADGAEYLIEVPSDWNGALFLYSHGYVVPGSANPARDVGDPSDVESGFQEWKLALATNPE